jgi:hypothetical protein
VTLTEDKRNAYKLRFGWESLKDRGHLKNLAVNGSIWEHHIKMDYEHTKWGDVDWIY